MKKTQNPALTSAGIILFATTLSSHSATLLSILGDAAAAHNNSTNAFSLLRVNDTAINVGGQGTANNTFRQAAIFPFQLPNFGSVTDPFQSATFTFHTGNPNNIGSRNADLYGLAARTTATIIPGNDFFMGGFDGGPANDTSPGVVKIQDNILIPTSVAGIKTTDATGNAALLNYLNSSYDGGNGAEHWVFLRFSLDTFSTNTSRYTISSTNNATEANRPFITYEAIPEPSAALLGGLGALLLLRRRR